MIKSESASKPLEVYYRPPGADQGIILQAEASLAEFVHFLGHTTTVENPAPGLGMSYGEAVGVVYHIWRQKFLQADFKAEQDRILAAIARLQEQTDIIERPEFTDQSGEGMYTPEQGATVPASDLGRMEFAPQPPLGPVPQQNPSPEPGRTTPGT
jgi:hypothetical protein